MVLISVGSLLRRGAGAALLGVLLCLVALVPAARAASGPAARAASGPATGRLALVLPLAADLGGLQRYAMAVATPGSSLYHHYRSIHWLARRFGASPATQQRVARYLRRHGATRIRLDRTGLFVDASLTRAQAERLFATTLVQRGRRADAVTAPTRPVRIPAALAGAVTGVVGLDTAPVLSAPAITRASPAERSAFSSVGGPITHTALDPGSGYHTASGTRSGCPGAMRIGAFTPNQYLTAYDYDPLHAGGTLGQGERVALIEVDGFRRSDISAFAGCFHLHIPRIVAFRADSSVSRTGLPPGGETTLDLEVLDAAAPNLSQIDVYESSAQISSALRAFTAPLQNAGYKPEVISASLGLCEPQVRQAVGLAGLRNSQAALAEAAASGISVLAATGDDGSADCIDPNSPQMLPLPQLAVNFPASSPDVTAVGGTNLTLNAANQITFQRVWNDDQVAPGSAGGGGLSGVFVRPPYQAGLVVPNRRALPDVSMLADIGPGYAVYCSAQPECVDPNLPGANSPWQAVGGTSAATPLLAGGFALVDELLRQHKQQGLGLVNPLLYALGRNPAATAQVFSDVTNGSNDVGPFIRSSHQPLGCCSAAPGFDTASGWGSVNLANLAAAALAAQPPLVAVSQVVPLPQRPLRTRAVLDRVSCTGLCQIGALARISVRGARTVTEYSGLYHLTRAGTKLVRIPLPRHELDVLRTAVGHHRRITVRVVGAIVDPAGNVERSTPPRAFTITR
ncbi:MAG TPA: S53 family peptidase [Solirubrobacteraceae bacterium]|nr:S53 family peptidase [Solirubrobacteraceae bacterium]